MTSLKKLDFDIIFIIDHISSERKKSGIYPVKLPSCQI